MKNKILFLLFCLASFRVAAQTIVDPSEFPVLTPTMDNWAIYTRENKINRKVLPAAIRALMLPIVRQPADITYTPASTGNANNKGSFVKTPLGRIYFIDGLGNSIQTNFPYAAATIADNDIHAGVMCVPVGGWYRLSNGNTIGAAPGTLRQRVFGSLTPCTNTPNAISPGQTAVVGGAGVLKVNGDPDTNPYVKAQSQWYEASVAYDTVLRQVYTYNSAGPLGNRWNVFQGLSVDTRVDSAYMDGDTLKMLILSVPGDTIQDTIKVTLSIPAGGIDTLSSYTALRSYTGASAVVVIQNFTYTFNSASYTTVGGLFHRVSTGTEDGGTLIVSANGVKWKRQWDGITAIPEWWVVGGYDVNGTTNPTRFTRNGIYNNRDRAVAAHMTAGVGGKVFYGTIVKEYMVDIDIWMFTDQRIESTGQVWFRRPNSPACWNTSTTTTTTLVVNDASQFRVGMGIMIADTANTRGAASNTFGGRGFLEGTRSSQISAISGNTITLTAAFVQPSTQGGTGTVGVGGRVFHQQHIFCHAGAVPVDKSEAGLTLATQGGNQHWQGVQIDGNRLNGGHGQFPFAWWLRNWSMEPGYGGKNIVIENCTFKNTPGENLSISRGKVENCNADSLGGSFVHYGEANPTTSATKPNPMYVTGNVIKNSCLATNAGTGHSEAAILNSNNTEWIIGQNIVLNCREAFVVIANEEQTEFVPDHKYQIIGNFVENCRYFIGASNVGSAVQPFVYRNLEIVGNTIRKSGDILLHFEDIYTNIGGRGIIISNNTIDDGRIHLRNVDGAIISHNTMLFHTDFHRPFNQRQDWGPGWSQYQLLAFNELASAILIQNCRAVTVDNNTIEGFETQNDSLSCGVNAGLEWFGWPQQLMNADTTLSDYLYPQNIKITNNNLYNFKYGIATATKPGRNMSSFGAEYQTVGWEISGNTIIMGKVGSSTAARSYGISCLPGMKVTGNKIYKQSSSEYDNPIIAYGASTPKQAWMTGPVIQHNEIYTGSYSEYAIQLNPDGNFFKNGDIQYNTIEGLIPDAWFNLGVEYSLVGFNDFLQHTLPLRTTPQKVKANSYALRKNLY